MNYHDEMLAHMRRMFPLHTFRDGPSVGKPDFDPAVSASIEWQPDSREVRAEFERFNALHQFCDGLESLTRATGIIATNIHPNRDAPERITDRHHYIIDMYGAIEWRETE